MFGRFEFRNGFLWSRTWTAVRLFCVLRMQEWPERWQTVSSSSSDVVMRRPAAVVMQRPAAAVMQRPAVVVMQRPAADQNGDRKRLYGRAYHA